MEKIIKALSPEAPFTPYSRAESIYVPEHLLTQMSTKKGASSSKDFYFHFNQWIYLNRGLQFAILAHREGYFTLMCSGELSIREDVTRLPFNELNYYLKIITKKAEDLLGYNKDSN